MDQKDRNSRGQFLKGTVPNPKGRPKKTKRVTLQDVIDNNERKILERYVERAYENDAVLIDLVNKIFAGVK